MEWRSARRRQHGSWLCAREGRWFPCRITKWPLAGRWVPCRITKWPLARRAPTSGAESAVDAGFRSRHHSLPRLLFVPRSRILLLCCVPLWSGVPMRYGEDTGQVVKMRERGAQTVQGCEQAQCSRRGSDIREMEIYGRWRYNNLIYAEALASPGPQPAELHHYHHDDVVRTSAAPWPLPLACLLPRRMERNACKPGRWLARLWGALIHTL